MVKIKANLSLANITMAGSSLEELKAYMEKHPNRTIDAKYAEKAEEIEM